MPQKTTVLEPAKFADMLSTLGPRMLGEILHLLLEDLARIEETLARSPDPVEFYQRLVYLWGEADTFGLVETAICSRHYGLILGNAFAISTARENLLRAIGHAVSELRNRLKSLNSECDGPA